MISVPQFNKYKDHYKRFLSDYKPYDEMYKWDSLKNFQDNWNIEAEDFKTMYDQSLQNDYASNLWAAQHFFPKGVMKQFIEIDKGRVKEMFSELFDESIDIEKRIDHFVYHCDILLPKIKEYDSNANNHYHSGNRIISVYLSFRYPETYTIYKYTEFKQMMEKLGAPNIPGTKEIGRFFKVMRTIFNMLEKDEELVSLIKTKTTEDKYFKNRTTLLAQDFYWCCTRENYAIENYK